MPRPRRNQGSRARGCGAFAAIAVGLACACGAPARPPIVEPAAPRLVGRFDRDGAFRWSNTRIEARFAGSAIAVRIAVVPPSEGAIPYTAFVDDRPPIAFVVGQGSGSGSGPGPSAERHVLATGLDPHAAHTVAVVREGEAHGGVHRFLGFDVEDGALLAPPAPRRRMEVVGDSITCGYGVLGESEACHFSFDTERASMAYAAIAARALDMDLVTECWSGRGVVRNYDGTTTGTMPELYEPPSASQPADDVVVVALGTNDILGGPLVDGKRAPLDTAAFEARYVAFLRRLRSLHPKARIVVASSPMLGDDPTPSGEGTVRAVARSSLDRIVAARHTEGDRDVLFFDMEYQGTRRGCDWHPNAAMQRRLGDALASFLRAHG